MALQCAARLSSHASVVIGSASKLMLVEWKEAQRQLPKVVLVRAEARTFEFPRSSEMITKALFCLSRFLYRRQTISTRGVHVDTIYTYLLRRQSTAFRALQLLFLTGLACVGVCKVCAASRTFRGSSKSPKASLIPTPLVASTAARLPWRLIRVGIVTGEVCGIVAPLLK